MTLKLMMMYHHTKFSLKRFSISEDLSGQTISIFNIHNDLDLKQSNPLFSLNTLAMMIYHQSKFDSERIISSEDIVETVVY